MSVTWGKHSKKLGGVGGHKSPLKRCSLEQNPRMGVSFLRVLLFGKFERETRKLPLMGVNFNRF